MSEAEPAITMPASEAFELLAGPVSKRKPIFESVLGRLDPHNALPPIGRYVLEAGYRALIEQQAEVAREKLRRAPRTA